MSIRKNNTLIVLLLAIVIPLIGEYFILVQKENEPIVGRDNGNGTSVEIPSTAPSSSEDVVNNGSWKKYNSSDLDVSFEYPSYVNILQEGEKNEIGKGYSIRFIDERESTRKLFAVLLSSADFVYEGVGGYPFYMTGDYFLDKNESVIESTIKERVQAVTKVTKMPNNFYAVQQEYVFGDNPVKATFYFTQRKNNELLNISVYQIDKVITTQDDLHKFLESFKF